MNYEVSQRHYFRENGQTLLPGQSIELTEEQAAEHNRNEPGLLKPARVTTQGHPEVVRILYGTAQSLGAGMAAEDASDQLVRLPSHTGLTAGDCDTIAATLVAAAAQRERV